MSGSVRAKSYSAVARPVAGMNPGFTSRRVLVTRATHQASELAEALCALGMNPIVVPTLEITQPTTYAPLDEALAHFEHFHWLLFTSANAVKACVPRWLAGGQGVLPGAPHVRIGVIGPATARAVRELGFTAALMPPQAVAESFTEALLPHARQADGTPTRFLLVRAEEARELLPETLRAAGGEVTVAPAYRTVIPQASIAAVRDLFSRPENFPEAVTFTSSSSVRNLLALLAEAGLNLPPEMLRVSIGPVTSRALYEAGLPPHAEASEPTVIALAAACRDV